jgi:hypothetical protein
MGLFDALEALATGATKVFEWATGGRTKDENTLRKEAEKWRGEFERAMAGRDFQHANYALAHLRRLHAEAVAKRRD